MRDIAIFVIAVCVLVYKVSSVTVDCPTYTNPCVDKIAFCFHRQSLIRKCDMVSYCQKWAKQSFVIKPDAASYEEAGGCPTKNSADRCVKTFCLEHEWLDVVRCDLADKCRGLTKHIPRIGRSAAVPNLDYLP